jgi:hypothetical protein
MSGAYNKQEEYLSIKHNYMPIFLCNIQDKKSFFIDIIVNGQHINLIYIM